MARIGINASFLDETLKEKLDAAAKAYGFETVYFSDNDDACHRSDGCEILFGNFPHAAIKGDSTLKWLHCSFAGVDRVISDDIYPNQNVVVTNSAGGYGVTISEHMIAVMLMMMRRMPEYASLVANRDWRIIGDIRSIERSVVTVVGMGDIGTKFATKVKALGAAKVKGVRRTKKPSPECYDEVYTVEDLDAAIKDSDVVALCVPGTDATKHLMDEHRFSIMKDGSYLINVGRGGAVDQVALKKALESGKLAGAALDVTTPEPLPKNDPLWDAPNIIITPHISGNMSLDITRELVVEMFCENLKRYASGEKLNNIVDRKIGY